MLQSFSQLFWEKGSTDPQGDPIDRATSQKRWIALAGVASLFLLACIFRFIDLHADPYWRLDWSTGLITDEAYYSGNARNLILFHHPSLFQFNNMVLSPLLHFLQVWIFKVFGVGVVPLRAMNGIFGIGASIVLALTFKKIFNLKAAFLAFLFLGLDTPFILYNRVALLETPLTFLLCLALLLTIIGIKKESVWQFIASGVLLGAAYITKSSVIIAFPCFAILMYVYWQNKKTIVPAVALLCGFLIVYVLWKALWVTPHHEEYTRMMDHYRYHQLQPESFKRLKYNIQIGFLGRRYGWARFHAQYQPILFLFSLLGIVGLNASKKLRHLDDGIGFALAAWLVSGWALMSVVNYAPTRYYVLFFPPLAGLALWTIGRMETVVIELRNSKSYPAAILVTLFSILFGYQFFGILGFPNILTWILSVPLTLLILRYIFIGEFTPKRVKNCFIFGTGMFFIHNLLLLPIFIDGFTHQLQEANQWMNANISASSIVMGNCAPPICMETKIKNELVIPGLANWAHTIQTTHATHIALLSGDGINPEPWWHAGYPDVIIEQNLIKSFTTGSFYILLYKVPSNIGRDFTETSFKFK